jgi:diguanylate cyclase (GGDEF)-like protein
MNIENTAEDELVNIMSQGDIDLRMVVAIAGDRHLNAREQNTLERLQTERGEFLYADMLYTLTHRSFPSRQAKILWGDILSHRKQLTNNLGRDIGISVATHDYLENVAKLLKGVSVIEESKMESFANVATHDGLTGLCDHNTFKHCLKDELERLTRYGGCLSLVMFDIDHFKKVNDTFGHAEGDAVLRELADIIRLEVRRLDTAARYGGEEFAAILPEVSAKEAYVFAERLRIHVEEAFTQGNIQITISLGIATAKDGDEESVESLIKRADTKLYEAKDSGRNRICF